MWALIRISKPNFYENLDTKHTSSLESRKKINILLKVFLSLLDKAPKNLVGCVIQKRCIVHIPGLGLDHRQSFPMADGTKDPCRPNVTPE